MQALITRFFKPQPSQPAPIVTPKTTRVSPRPTPTTLNIEDEWALFDQACAIEFPSVQENDESSSDESNSDNENPNLVASYDQLINNQRIDPQFPKNSNHTKIDVATTAQDRRLRQMLQWNLDGKEYQAWKDKQWATDVLQRGQVAEQIMAETVEVFCGVCRLVELKRKKNKKRILTGALYYVLKRYEQPTLEWVASILQITKAQTSLALKDFRLLARELPNELGWIFDVERGQTSLFRFASESGLSRADVKRINTHINENKLDRTNNTVIRSLIVKCSKGKI